MKPFDSFGWSLSIFFPCLSCPFSIVVSYDNKREKKMKAYQIFIGSNFLASTTLQKKFLTLKKKIIILLVTQFPKNRPKMYKISL